MLIFKCRTESNIGSWLVFEYMELGDLANLLRSANEISGTDAKPANNVLKDKVIRPNDYQSNLNADLFKPLEKSTIYGDANRQRNGVFVI